MSYNRPGTTITSRLAKAAQEVPQRIPQAGKRVSNCICSTVKHLTRTPSYSTIAHMQRSDCQGSWSLRIPVKPRELSLWSMFLSCPWLLWFLWAFLPLLHRTPKICLLFGCGSLHMLPFSCWMKVSTIPLKTILLDSGPRMLYKQDKL